MIPHICFVCVDVQINLKPTISKTTDEAIKQFTPKIRHCYSGGEAKLTHLILGDGYRYELNNCVLDEKIKEIIWNCRCRPKIWENCVSCEPNNEYNNAIKKLPFCTGRKLYCANYRMRSLGFGKTENNNMTVMPDAMESPKKIGNVTEPSSIDCLPRCNVQEDNQQLSLSLYPQLETFFYRETFCIVASHILSKTCSDGIRRSLLHKRQPNLCPSLEFFNQSFDDCRQEVWPEKFLQKYHEINETLRNEMYEYGRSNLALVHIVIQVIIMSFPHYSKGLK